MTNRSAPQIEGCLKDTIHSIAFGVIGAVFIVNFGIAWIPNFFPWVMATLVVLQLVLFLPERAKPDYEKYVEPGRKGRHVIHSETGQIVLEGSREDGQGTSQKTKSSKIRDKFRKKGQKGSAGEIFLEVPKDGRVRRRSSASNINELATNKDHARSDETTSLAKEVKDDSKEKEIEGKSEKEKETPVEIKVEQEPEKEEKEGEVEKEKSSWRQRLHFGTSR